MPLWQHVTIQHKKSNKANSSHTNIFNDKEMLNRIKLSHNKELNAKIAYH